MESEDDDEEKEKKEGTEKVEQIDTSALMKMYACVVLGSIYVFLRFAPHPFH